MWRRNTWRVAAPALSAERVLREALRLADEEGLAAVGMPRLGRELGGLERCRPAKCGQELVVL